MQTTDQDPKAKARAWHVITPGGRHWEAAGKLPVMRQIIAVGSAKGGIGKSPARISGTKVNARPLHDRLGVTDGHAGWQPF